MFHCFSHKAICTSSVSLLSIAATFTAVVDFVYLSEVQQLLVNSGVTDVWNTMLKSILRLLSNENEEEETSPELLDVS